MEPRNDTWNPKKVWRGPGLSVIRRTSTPRQAGRGRGPSAQLWWGFSWNRDRLRTVADVALGRSYDDVRLSETHGVDGHVDGVDSQARVGTPNGDLLVQYQ